MLEGSLKLFNYADIILRLRGRFAHSKQIYVEKPFILLRDLTSYFTVLVIRDAHKDVPHQGIESTLSFIRSIYWTLKGRKTVKSVLCKFTICRRHQGRAKIPLDSPDLPDCIQDHCI